MKPIRTAGTEQAEPTPRLEMTPIEFDIRRLKSHSLSSRAPYGLDIIKGGIDDEVLVLRTHTRYRRVLEWSSARAIGRLLHPAPTDMLTREASQLRNTRRFESDWQAESIGRGGMPPPRIH